MRVGWRVIQCAQAVGLRPSRTFELMRHQLMTLKELELRAAKQWRDVHRRQTEAGQVTASAPLGAKYAAWHVNECPAVAIGCTAPPPPVQQQSMTSSAAGRCIGDRNSKLSIDCTTCEPVVQSPQKVCHVCHSGFTLSGKKSTAPAASLRTSHRATLPSEQLLASSRSADGSRCTVLTFLSCRFTACASGQGAIDCLS